MLSTAEELSRYPAHISQEIVDRLRHRMTEPPSVAQVRQCAREVLQTTSSPRLEAEVITPLEKLATDRAAEAAFADYFSRHPRKGASART